MIILINMGAGLKAFMMMSSCECRFTEALLDPLSSSLEGWGAAPLRDRGEVAGALRRDLCCLEESSYSSANEKRSLNLAEERSDGHLVKKELENTIHVIILPSQAKTHLILWASSQLAWTCCRACNMGVWEKTDTPTRRIQRSMFKSIWTVKQPGF